MIVATRINIFNHKRIKNMIQTDIDAVIQQNLKSILKDELNLSHKEIAKLADVCKVSVSYYITGKRKITIGTLATLAANTNVPIQKFLGLPHGNMDAFVNKLLSDNHQLYNDYIKVSEKLNFSKLDSSELKSEVKKLDGFFGAALKEQGRLCGQNTELRQWNISLCVVGVFAAVVIAWLI